MIDLLTITDQPELASQCDRMPGMRLFVDLERNGKAERQAGRNTFISSHSLEDVVRIRAALRKTPLMVRVNPYQPADPEATRAEVEQVLAAGADLLMLPMFQGAAEIRAFLSLVAGRLPVVALLETAGALSSLEDWIDAPGLNEVFVGLNDLHLSLGYRFMFEPLLHGHVDRVAVAVRQRGMRFGFGGIARVGDGMLAGEDVLAEHLRLGSRAVILSRTFNRDSGPGSFQQGVEALRHAEVTLATRSAVQVEADRVRIAGQIRLLADAARRNA